MLESVNMLEHKAQYIRNRILDMCCNAGTGHITSAFSCTEILVALYYGGILNFDPQNPEWDQRDRFILSKGHASIALYSILADLGFFPENELAKYNLKDGKFGVHLQHDVPGVEITTGSLGNGFGVAAGMALAAGMNREIHMVFALLGDAECYEGSIWETAMFAAHNRLNNLVAIVDRNHLGVTNFTENMVALEPIGEKWRTFGWNVKNIDGHSFTQILDVLKDVRSRKSDKPLVVVADTVKGRGISFMSNIPIMHGAVPKGQDAIHAKNELSKG